MTKPVASVALMMLFEQRQSHLGTPASAYLPEFSECRALIDSAMRIDQTVEVPSPTIHHLLTQIPAA